MFRSEQMEIIVLNIYVSLSNLLLLFPGSDAGFKHIWLKLLHLRLSSTAIRVNRRRLHNRTVTGDRWVLMV